MNKNNAMFTNKIYFIYTVLWVKIDNNSSLNSGILIEEDEEDDLNLHE